MITRKLLFWSPAFLFLAYVFSFQQVNSHASQPDAGSVKDPVNNQSCSRIGCHSTFAPFNASRATVTIGTTQANQVPLNGFQYATGTQYIINFTALGGSLRPGFEMSAITASNTNAGTFALTNTTNTTLQTQGGISYVGHKNASSNSTWSFNWTSPVNNVGNITFYTAVNRSNNSNSSSGDSIFHQQFMISAPAAVTVSAGNDVTICPNASTQLQATASITSGTTYAWSPSTNLSCTNCANPTASPASGTTYTVTVTNGGQTASDAVVVNTYSTTTPVISPTSTTVCPGGSVTLSSTGFSSYAWSTGGGSSSTVVTTGGTYTLTAADAHGCTTTGSQIIQQGQTPTPIVSSTHPYLCGGNSATLSAGNFSAYQWSNNATTPTISVSQAGSYVVTVTNNQGCSASATINLQSYALPVADVTVSGPLTFCTGGSVTLTANSGIMYSYKWSTGAATDAITVSQSGSYKVTVYNPCDSAVSTSQNVVVNPAPDAQINPSGALLICPGSPQILHASPLSATYKWLKNGNVVPGQTKDSLSVNTAASYQVVVTQGNCSDTSDAVLISTAGTGNATVSITASQNHICTGDVVTLDAGAGFSTYSWTPVNGASQTVQVNSAGTYIVNVTVNNGQCNSTGSDTIIISTGTNVTAPTLSYDSTICAGDSVVITVSPSSFSAYLWSNGTNSPVLNDVTGTYTVTVSQTGFCGTASATINAEGTPLPDASFTNNSGLLIASTSGAIYQWFIEGSLIQNATDSSYTALQTGNYSLQVSLNGCSATSVPEHIVISGLDGLNNELSFVVYPNPVGAILNFAVDLNSELDLQMGIKNLDGRDVRDEKSIHLKAGPNRIEYNLSNLPEGIYVLLLQNGDFRKTLKVIRQNQ